MMRVMRTMAAGPPRLALAGRVARVAGGSNKRCVSTVYSESHDHLTEVREGFVCVLLLALFGTICIRHIQRVRHMFLELVPEKKLLSARMKLQQSHMFRRCLLVTLHTTDVSANLCRVQHTCSHPVLDLLGVWLG